jgi:alpha-tubulin suppressor-like RCC1 family protein
MCPPRLGPLATIVLSLCVLLLSCDPHPTAITEVVIADPEWPDTVTLGSSFSVQATLVTVAGDTVLDPIPNVELSRNDIIRVDSVSRTTLHWTAVGKGMVEITTTFAATAGLSAAASRVDTLRVMEHWTAVAAGEEFTCALVRDGTAYCWGENTFFSFGNQDTEDSSLPTLAAGGLRLAEIAVAQLYGCGISLTGQGFCWGDNDDGQLGTGSRISFSSTPAPISGDLVFSSISTGLNHACGMTPAGQTYCWGADSFGALGGSPATEDCNLVDPERKCRLQPGRTGLERASRISAGWSHSCAIGDDQRAFCWGNNFFGQSGDGNISSGIPIGASRNLRFTDIAAGGETSCGIAVSGDAYCWGKNQFGELGILNFYIGLCGSISCSATPLLIPGGMSFSKIAVGQYHVCGLTRSGGVACWGLNLDGQLGVPVGAPVCGLPCSHTPQLVASSKRFVRLAVGANHTCALAEDGALYCWGSNRSGRLGDGTTENRSMPTRVADPI